MNLWIKVEVDILKHYKTRNLRRLLGLATMREAAGYPISLWMFTIEHAWRDGDLTEYGIDGIEDACEWRGEPGKLVKAMQTCGKAGGHGFLHRDALIAHEFTQRARLLVKNRLYRESKKPDDVIDEKPGEQIPADILLTWNEFAAKCGLPKSKGFKSGPIDGEIFHQAIAAAEKQSFLMGKGPKGWKMDLRWLLRDDNLAKVAANAYGDGPAAAVSGPHRPTSDEQNDRNAEVLRRRGLL